jgi:hypothetical protein
VDAGLDAGITAACHKFLAVNLAWEKDWEDVV